MMDSDRSRSVPGMVGLRLDVAGLLLQLVGSQLPQDAPMPPAIDPSLLLMAHVLSELKGLRRDLAAFVASFEGNPTEEVEHVAAADSTPYGAAPR